jgi:hypothetical protein
MDVDDKKARDALRDVEAAARSIRGRLAYGIAGPILALWGAVWIVCFALVHFAPRISGWGWIIGDALGIAGSIYIGHCHKNAAGVRSESSKRLGWRLFWSWLFLFVYAGIWLAIFWPWNGQQLGMFLVTVVMFAYVVMGLWLEMPFLMWLGLAVTTLAGAGYLLSFIGHGYLDLWLGVTCGSALLVAGLYLMLRWK